MKAMLLAAGLGTRLRPLTDHLPKPLLQVDDATLIEHHLRRLRHAGFQDVVINLHYLGHLIEKKLGNGSQWGLRIQYSREDDLLETGGGIKAALNMLGDGPFAVVSADVYMDFDYSQLPRDLAKGSQGCLVMVPNPPHHPNGDYGLQSGQLTHSGNRMTYSGISVLMPDILEAVDLKVFPLRRVFEEAIKAGRLSGMAYAGYWCDVGTLERYEDLKKHLSSQDPDA